MNSSRANFGVGDKHLSRDKLPHGGNGLTFSNGERTILQTTLSNPLQGSRIQLAVRGRVTDGRGSWLRRGFTCPSKAARIGFRCYHPTS